MEEESCMISKSKEIKASNTYTSEDVDQGWAWVVCAAAFFADFFALGFAYSIGVYYVIFLDVFESGNGVTAWISSLNFGVLCAVGPIASIMNSKFGARVTMFSGSLISSLGLVISSQVTNIYLLAVFVGIVTGAGLGLVFASSVVVITFYFKKYRPLAMGLSISGAAFGTCVYPWLNRYLVDLYGWRGALLVAAALNLNVCVCASLIRPQKVSYIESREALNPRASWRTFHLDVFCIPAFVFLCVNCFLFTFGMGVVYTHVGAYARSMQMGHSSGKILISSLGISNLVGRIGLGALGQMQCINVSILFIISYLIAGVAIIISGVWTTFGGVLICLTTFGLFSGAFGPLLSEVTCQIVGVYRFNHGYGYLMLHMALGTTLGAPAAGALYDVTEYYPASFYLGGGALVLSSFVMLQPVIYLFRQRPRTPTIIDVYDVISAEVTDKSKKTSPLEAAWVSTV